MPAAVTHPVSLLSAVGSKLSRTTLDRPPRLHVTIARSSTCLRHCYDILKTLGNDSVHRAADPPQAEQIGLHSIHIIWSAWKPMARSPHPSREGARRVRSPRSHISGLVVGLTLCPFATYL